MLVHYQVIFWLFEINGDSLLGSFRETSWDFVNELSWVVLNDRSLSRFSSVLYTFKLGKVKLTLSEGMFSKCYLSLWKILELWSINPLIIIWSSSKFQIVVVEIGCTEFVILCRMLSRDTFLLLTCLTWSILFNINCSKLCDGYTKNIQI